MYLKNLLGIIPRQVQVSNSPRSFLGLLRVCIAGLIVIASSSAAADNFKAFTVDSFQQIKESYTGQEFLLGLWSVDCPPCLVELKFMGELLALNPGLPYVLVSTDPIEQREYSADFLEDFGLMEMESWMFADSFVERLRYSIDSNWYGELPRSYFFDANHNMKSHSGIVNRDLLTEWFSVSLEFE